MKAFWVLMLVANLGFAELVRSESSHCFQCNQPPERYETVTLPDSEGKYLYPRDESSFAMPGGWRYTKEIQLRLKSSYSSRLEVWVNGQLRDTLNLPGSPWSQHFTLPIGRTTDRVAVRNSGQNPLEVEYIRAVVVCFPAPPVVIVPGPVPVYPVLPPQNPYPTIKGLPSHNVASWLAKRAIELVDSLRDDVDPSKEYVRYLLPIKLEGAKAYAVGTTHGDLSEETRKALVVLHAQIVTADELLNDLMKRKTVFERAVELVAVKHEIAQRLR